MLWEIISGGQTGADGAALNFAIENNIPHDGRISNERQCRRLLNVRSKLIRDKGLSRT